MTDFALGSLKPGLNISTFDFISEFKFGLEFEPSDGCNIFLDPVPLRIPLREDGLFFFISSCNTFSWSLI